MLYPNYNIFYFFSLSFATWIQHCNLLPFKLVGLITVQIHVSFVSPVPYPTIKMRRANKKQIVVSNHPKLAECAIQMKDSLSQRKFNLSKNLKKNRRKN